LVTLFYHRFAWLSYLAALLGCPVWSPCWVALSGRPVGLLCLVALFYCPVGLLCPTAFLLPLSGRQHLFGGKAFLHSHRKDTVWTDFLSIKSGFATSIYVLLAKEFPIK
jgi:hypothetical protein